MSSVLVFSMANDNHPTYLLRSSEELRRPTVHAFGSIAEALNHVVGESPDPDAHENVRKVLFERDRTWYDRNGDGWRTVDVPAPAPSNPEKLTEEEIQFLTYLVGGWVEAEARDQFWKSMLAGTGRGPTERLRKASALLKKLQDMPVFEEPRT